MLEVIINNTRVKLEGGEIYAFCKRNNCKVCKWHLLKGSVNNTGYNRLTITKKKYLYHRVIYKLHNHDWDISDISPNNFIDHIDRNPLNNNIDNLRVVSQQQNMFNTSGKGYTWIKKANKWLAQISINNKNKPLGYFVEEQDARDCYLAAKKLYHSID